MLNRHLVIDAMNVIGSRPTGWWRDRTGALRALVARLQRLAAIERDEITVVVDGRPLPDLPEGIHDGVQVLYARRSGPNAADDRIVEFVEAHPEPSNVEVVTSDRDLIRRVAEHGARIHGPRRLLERLDQLDPEP
jgi:predicted RNA-binding protein with PIN domain